MKIKINIPIREKGYTFFANILNLDGLAKKLNVLLIINYYSHPNRIDLEAKKGEINREIGKIADNAYICPVPPKPEISAVIAPDTNIKTGNINGNKTSAVRTPPLPIAQDKAAGVAPIKVREGVPNKRVNANIHQY